MSLLLVGSCSQVAQNIILQLSRNKAYSSITIGDLLPRYSFHQRYYKLKQKLSSQKSQTAIDITKFIQPQDIRDAIHSHQDVLYVTHDYYEHVISKTELMKLVAQNAAECKDHHVVFATPVQYDHHGYSQPEHNYLEAQEHTLQTLPDATIIRSDVQDTTELTAYLNAGKNIISQQLLSAGKGVYSKIVNAQQYAQIVADNLTQRSNMGKVLCIQGTQEVKLGDVNYNKQLGNDDYSHWLQHTQSFIQKYTGNIGERTTISQD